MRQQHSGRPTDRGPVRINKSNGFQVGDGNTQHNYPGGENGNGSSNHNHSTNNNTINLPPPERSKSKSGGAVACISIAAILAIAIAIGAYLINPWHASSSEDIPPVQDAVASFSEPLQNAEIKGCSKVSGTVSGLGNSDNISLVTRVDSGAQKGYYYLTDNIQIPPKGSGHWEVPNAKIGSSSSGGQKFTLMVLKSSGDLASKFVSHDAPAGKSHYNLDESVVKAAQELSHVSVIRGPETAC